MRIGRHSASRGLEPEIDLTGPPTDPGVSRLHAVLTAQPDASWAILDPGSENGTSVNGSEMATGVPVPLHDDDQIHVGAWTVITVHGGYGWRWAGFPVRRCSCGAVGHQARQAHL
jgi:pSer/pThr/pTyr-binding forkhead associated (FHA) protein